jgi:hypothetical protein
MRLYGKSEALFRRMGKMVTTSDGRIASASKIAAMQHPPSG